MILYKHGRLKTAVFGFYCILVISVSGCRSQRCNTRIVSHGFSSSETVMEQSCQVSALLAASDLQAKAADIPVPLGAQLLENRSGIAEQGEGFYLSYATTDDRQQVMLFYQQEMERLGWQSYALLVAQEVVCVFGKPRHHAVIVLRPDGQKNAFTTITVYVMDA